jgi:outer membrane receptor protein involved in Fe transport
VDDYLITYLWIGKTIVRKNFRLTVTGEVNNLFNVEYQARPGYPMPGINYKAGLQINFNKPNRI